MANWREVKRQALRPVHSTFAIPAVYLTHAAGNPVPLTARYHPRPVDGAIGGEDWSSVGQRFETEDLVLLPIDLLPGRKAHPNSYVIFSDEEAYRTGPARKARGDIISVACSTVTAQELSQLLSETDLSLDAWKVIAPWSLQ